VKEAYNSSRICNVPVEELYNAGRSGLIRAAYGYKPHEFNTKFSTYATPWIKHGIREIIHGDSPAKIPVHIINGAYKKNKALSANKDLTEEELRNELEVTEAQMDRINKAKITSVSLDTPIYNQKMGCSENNTLGDFLPDEKAEIPGTVHLEDPRYDFVNDALKDLSEIDRDIITSQVLNADKVNLRILGEKYGMSGERIRQKKEKALKQLRARIIYRMNLRTLNVEPIMKEAVAETEPIAKTVEIIEKDVVIPPKRKRGRPRKIKL
jgi:RNA polymerase primary sigma factor